MKTHFVTTIIGSAIALSSCQKQPVACFDYEDENPALGNYEYSFTNCSTEATTYEWDFGDGITSTMASPEHGYSNAGTYTVTMTAFSENGRKEDESQTTIHVLGDGYAVFWNSGASHFIILNLQGEAPAPLSPFNGQPTGCMSGYPFHLEEGTYSYTAQEQSPGTGTWSGTVTVTNGGCTQIVF